MRKLNALLVSTLITVGLFGCGGGSGGGGGGALAGNYVGTATFTFTGPGGRVTVSDQAVVTVSGDGSLSFALFSSTSTGTSCTATPPVFLNGNSFNYSIRYSCNISGLGVCNIVESGQGTINGVTLTASVNGTATCPQGTVAVVGNMTANKQASLLLPPRAGSEGVGKAIEQALGH